MHIRVSFVISYESLIARAQVTSTKMGEKYHVINGGENVKKRSCGVVFVHNNDQAECSTSGNTNSKYFSVKFCDLTYN